MNENKLFTPQERQEFRALEGMFQSEGWQLLKSQMQDEVDNGPNHWFLNASSWEEIVAARARMRAVYELLNYETITENRKAGLLQSRQQQVQDSQEDNTLEYL